MTDRSNNRTRTREADGRRRQLRNMLLTAADAARQTRRVTAIAGRIGRPVGRAIRDRVSTLLIAV
jgi:hypothetical protein